MTDFRWRPANLGYHVNIVFFADAQMLRRGVVAFESLPELITHHAKSGRPENVRNANENG